MPKQIRMRKQERVHANDRRMEMQAKELGKGRKDLPLVETRAERMAAEEGRAMNKPTESKRVVAVIKGKVVAPRATKMVMKSIAEKVAKARAAKGIQSEKYRK